MTWRNVLFSVSHQTATGLSRLSTDWGRSLPDIYVKAKLNHSQKPNTGNRLPLGWKSFPKYLNKTFKYERQLQISQHSLPATWILHPFNQFVFKSTFQQTVPIQRIGRLIISLELRTFQNISELPDLLGDSASVNSYGVITSHRQVKQPPWVTELLLKGRRGPPTSTWIGDEVSPRAMSLRLSRHRTAFTSRWVVQCLACRRGRVCGRT